MKSIIHFTSEFETLKAIINSTSLRLFYCKEDFYLGKKMASSAVHPMVSFSEYTIETIDSEKITYGKFGIAFKKSWVIEKKLHPVLYVDKNSLIASSLADLLTARRKNAKTQLTPKIKLAIMTIKCFTKNAIGYNSYFKTENFDFKSENEWRYVPTKDQIKGKLISQSKSIYLTKPEYYNDKLKDYSLKFIIPDIEYIFVSNNLQKRTIEQLNLIPKDKIKISNWTTH